MTTVYKQMIKSRAVSSVEVMYRVSGPNTGSNPGEGRILKKKKKKIVNFRNVVRKIKILSVKLLAYFVK